LKVNFSSFEEMTTLMKILMKTKFDKESSKRIKAAISAASVFDDDSSKIFRLWATLEIELWKIEEAVELGFHRWIEEQRQNVKLAVKYHEHNCNDKCEFCEEFVCAR
tara:strand:- start:269 stop:589 length:321 start_codon:yes stop_codon:yes gene_type:complete